MVLVVRAAIQAHDDSDICHVTCVVSKTVSFEALLVEFFLPELVEPDLPGGLIRGVSKLLPPATSCTVVKFAFFFFEDRTNRCSVEDELLWLGRSCNNFVEVCKSCKGGRLYRSDLSVSRHLSSRAVRVRTSESLAD